MRKKLLSLCMALALCLGLLPVTALAEGTAPDNLYVGDQVPPVGRDSYWTTSTDGKLITCEATNDWNVAYDAGSTTLTLKNATIEGVLNDVNTAGTGIYAASSSGAVSLNIVLEGENRVSGGHGINVSSGKAASLSISGSGSLTVSATAINGVGILVQAQSDANLTINGANVNAVVTETNGRGVELSTGHAGNPNLTIEVQGGSLQASGQPNGIRFFTSANDTRANANLKVSGNAMVKTSGITTEADGTGSALELTTGAGTSNTGGIVWNGSEGTVYGNVTLQENLEIGEGESLTLDDGASLNAGNHNVIVDGGTLDESLKESLGENVKYAPTIVTPPADKSVTEGETATFTVAANGTEPLSYQWQQSTDNGSNWTKITGETNTTYTTGKTTMDMNGTQYRCVVKNSIDEVTSNAATLTVTAKPTYTVTVNANPTEGGTANADRQTAAEAETVTLTATPNSNYRFVGWTSDGGVTFADASSLSTTFTMPAGNVTITANWQYDPPYIPPTKTPSEQALDKIEDAKPGDTVTINIFGGNTKLDKEVFEELAGRDVTLEISLSNGVTWTVNGQDIPANAKLTDIDMGVSLNTSTIPVNLINSVTGEAGTVQLTLKHNGEFGFTMTLTAPVGVKNAGLWANLYHYDEDAGKMVYQTAALVDEDGNVALPFDHASQYALVLDSKSHDLPFTDLAANAWYTDAVAYVYRHDIMEGMSETEFAPATALTRAMAVQIFYNLEGQPDLSGENLGYPYEDVNAQAWYGDAVYWARITGVATGYGDGTFQPGDSITRQEFAQMLYNYAKYKGYDLTAQGDLSQFPDSGSVADWAEAAMSWANGNKLINGHDDGTIDAGGAGTRAQAASILMRFDENVTE